MIYKIKGMLLEKDVGVAVIDTGSVAFEISISMTTYSALPDKGGEASVFTHFNMTENGVSLYGFATMEEKKLFQLLNTVSKIGPKSALSILSGISPKKFRESVSAGDVGLLSTIPGIGKKTAERIIVELKDKFGEVILETHAEGSEDAVNATAGFDDVVGALVNFGYQRAEASRVVKKVIKPGSKFEDVFRDALKELSNS